MNIEQLIYVVEIYEAGSFTKASKKCHVTVPAISQAITSLENELEILIFNRSRSGIYPTERGMKIIKKAYEITNKLKELKEEVAPQKLSGSLHIAAVPSFIMILVMSAYAFKNDHPSINIEITEKSTPEVIEGVKKNKFDLGFSLIDKEVIPEYAELEYNGLVQGKNYLCVSKNSKLATREYVEPYEILDQQLAIYSGHLQKQFMNTFFNKYGKMKILFESNQIEIIMRTVNEGFAVSFLNELLLRDDQRVKNGDIIPLTVKGTSIRRSFGWSRLKQNYFSPTAKEFIKYVEYQLGKEAFNILPDY